MRKHPLIEQGDQLWLHKLVIVWNIQTHHFLARQIRLEALRQLTAMAFSITQIKSAHSS